MKEYRMKCTRCGQINSAEDMKIDYVDGGYYGEPHMSCSCCGHDDWDEVFQCADCGEWFTEDEMVEDLCRDCFDKNATVENVTEYGEEYKEDVEINGLYAYAFTPAQINSILAREFAALNGAAQKKAAAEIVSDDPYNFREWAREAV